MKKTNFLLTKENVNVLRSHILRIFNKEKSLVYSGFYPLSKKHNSFIKQCGLVSKHKKIEKITTQFFNLENISFRIEAISKYSQDSTIEFVVRNNGIFILSFPLNQKMRITHDKIFWKKNINGKRLLVNLAVNKNQKKADDYIARQKRENETWEKIFMADMERSFNNDLDNKLMGYK